jgi:hypothetical protein
MNSPVPPQRVPTLTEVIEWQAPGGLAGAGPVPPGLGPGTAPPVSAPGAGDGAASGHPEPAPQAAASGVAVDEGQIVERVLVELQRQVDLMLEYRLREALKPVLTRATDAVLREARNELASTLRDVVARAVTQELARHRKH